MKIYQHKGAYCSGRIFYLLPHLSSYCFISAFYLQSHFHELAPDEALKFGISIHFSEPTKMELTAAAPGLIPNRYIGTYLTKPATRSTSRAPFWNAFSSNRIGPTSAGELPRFLEEFHWFHAGKPDPKFETLTNALRECNRMTHSVYLLLEQTSVRNKPEKMLLLDRALSRNHEIWYTFAYALHRSIENSPQVIHLFTLGRNSNAFEEQHSGAGKTFLEKLVKKTVRDRRSWNPFRRSYLIDEMREYILTTGMLISDIEDELDE